VTRGRSSNAKQEESTDFAELAASTTQGEQKKKHPQMTQMTQIRGKDLNRSERLTGCESEPNALSSSAKSAAAADEFFLG
jgi:hypothetical protein